MEAGSLEVFKVEVDKYLIDRGIEGDGEMAQKRCVGEVDWPC